MVGRIADPSRRADFGALLLNKRRRNPRRFRRFPLPAGFYGCFVVLTEASPVALAFALA